ncbi:MAG: hypothetical protein ACLPX1_02585 [Steroidobacteraceae bacterium]
MAQNYLVKSAAWLEIGAGPIVIVAPNFASMLLFAAPLEGPGLPVARFAGIGLLALGCACLMAISAGASRSAVWGLYIFNAAATVLFAGVGLSRMPHGVLLWPVAILHAVIAVGLASGGGLRKTR